jgi:hypothetical protein
VLDFESRVGDAIAVYGPAGGTHYFVSVGELDVYGWRAVASAQSQPVAQLAAAPALVLGGEDVSLDARASFDPNGEPLEYVWSQIGGPEVTLLDAGSSRPHFVAPRVTGPVTLTFSLTVGAGGRTSAVSSVTVTVSALDGPVDLSVRGKILISEPAPIGGGSRNIEVIRDGLEPAPGSADLLAQWDTFTGDPTISEGWVGYEFPDTYRFGRLHFQEGGDFYDGGWFDGLGVEVRRDGHWFPVQGLRSTPAYPGASDGVGFQAYDLEFTPTLADAIRLVGAPGGLNRFFSVAELRAFAVPPPAANAVPSASAGPDFSTGSGATVTLDGSRSIDPEAAALTYAWQQVAGPNVALSNAAVAAPSFAAPSVGDVTELIFSLTVDDGTSSSPPDRVSVVVGPQRTAADVTSYATILCSVRFPNGGGARTLEVIRDGVVPLPGDVDAQLQYDTFTGLLTDSGFIGYRLPGLVTFSRLVFQEGLNYPNGGWFTTLDIEVRRAGEWRRVGQLTSTPSYLGGSDATGFQTYTLDFRPEVGDAIRMIGAPGGAATFFSVAELRAFAL